MVLMKSLIFLSSFFLIYFIFPEIICKPIQFFNFKKENLKIKKIKLKEEKICFAERGEGETLIFVHGFQGEKYFWLPYIKNFLNFHIILIDLPAHGKSSYIKGKDYNLENFADILNQFIEKKNLKNFSLVGTSLGGAISLEYAFKYGENLKKLILLNPIGIKPKNEEFEKIIKKNEEMFFPNNLKELDSLYFYLMGKPFLKSDIFKRFLLKRLIKKRKIFKRIFQDVTHSRNLENILSNIKMPTLLLCGKFDNILGEKDFEIYRKNLENSLCFLIEGHHIFTEKAFLQASSHISNFIN